MRGWKFLVLGCVLGLSTFGCSEDEDGPTDADEGKPPAAMVGTWRFNAVTVGGAPADLADVLEWQPATVAAEILIQANSAYVYQEVNGAGGQLWFRSGFVFIDGNEMDVNAQLDGDGPVNETRRYAWTLGLTDFTLSRTAGGVTTVFTLGMPKTP